MWGLFVLAALGIGAMVHSCKNDMENSDIKDRAIKNGEKYYLDTQGKTRSVDNNHQVLRHTTAGHKHNWDTVDLDMKTGQILRNYSQEERDSISVKKRQMEEENRKRKQTAISEGHYWYEVKEPPIKGYAKLGVFSSSYGTFAYDYYQQALNGIHPKEDLSCYESHKYRISDNLLLNVDTRHYDVVREHKCQLIVYDYEAENRYDIGKIEWNANWNRTQCSSSYTQGQCKMTEEEMLSYARKIGAYLPEMIEEKKNQFQENIKTEVAKVMQKYSDEDFDKLLRIFLNFYEKRRDTSFGKTRFEELVMTLENNEYVLEKETILAMLRKTRECCKNRYK